MRLCIPALINKLRVMNPSAFEEKNRDSFFFTMSDGKVLPKCAVERLLRMAALRLGMDPRILASHSLRAGGCSAMFDAKFADHEIQRRGRWMGLQLLEDLRVVGAEARLRCGGSDGCLRLAPVRARAHVSSIMANAC